MAGLTSSGIVGGKPDWSTRAFMIFETDAPP
jgi:hypothetical protein